MISANRPDNEAERLDALRRYEILDTPSQAGFDDITEIAAQLCQTPVALISLVDEDRQWFKSRCGLTMRQTSRDVAFCSHAILEPEVFVVPDATVDERFADNPLVTGEPHIRFYAGAPLMTPDGYEIGTLCVIDRKPRELDDQQRSALEALSRQVVAQLELRRTARELRQALEAKRSPEE